MDSAVRATCETVQTYEKCGEPLWKEKCAKTCGQCEVSDEEVFKAMDTNRKGQVAPEQIIQFVEKNGRPLTEKEKADVFAVCKGLDKDGNGLNLEEFKNYQREMNAS